MATTRLSRLLGLALLCRARAGGLLIPRCRSVHTLGMLFHLDLIFVDLGGRVIEIRRDVPPIRLILCPAAEHVLELPSEQTSHLDPRSLRAPLGSKAWSP